MTYGRERVVALSTWTGHWPMPAENRDGRLWSSVRQRQPDPQGTCASSDHLPVDLHPRCGSAGGLLPNVIATGSPTTPREDDHRPRGNAPGTMAPGPRTAPEKRRFLACARWKSAVPQEAWKGPAGLDVARR